mmetsp:Transcript_5293/g.17600  ORF Transcript_5293/g.17600 Transcript_5293/m.17600 type:complete len:301 (-) Transcript_5293:1917-2819(-)
MPTTTPTRQSRTRWMPTREPTSRCSWSAFRTAWRWRICSGWATASSRAWSTARAATHPASSSPTPTTPSYCAPRTASSCRASQCWATARAITRTWPSLTRAALSSRRSTAIKRATWKSRSRSATSYASSTSASRAADPLPSSGSASISFQTLAHWVPSPPPLSSSLAPSSSARSLGRSGADITTDTLTSWTNLCSWRREDSPRRPKVSICRRTSLRAWTSNCAGTTSFIASTSRLVKAATWAPYRSFSSSPSCRKEPRKCPPRARRSGSVSDSPLGASSASTTPTSGTTLANSTTATLAT